MSAHYVKNPEDGQVHVVSSGGDGQFTFCDRDYGEDGPDGEFYGVTSSGPATCQRCKEAVDEVRLSITDIRWRL